MILPTKSVDANQALLTVGADIIEILTESARTVSSVWSDVRRKGSESELAPISFEWFVLSLDFLFALGAVELRPSGTLELTPQ